MDVLRTRDLESSLIAERIQFKILIIHRFTSSGIDRLDSLRSPYPFSIQRKSPSPSIGHVDRSTSIWKSCELLRLPLNRLVSRSSIQPQPSTSTRVFATIRPFKLYPSITSHHVWNGLTMAKRSWSLGQTSTSIGPISHPPSNLLKRPNHQHLDGLHQDLKISPRPSPLLIPRVVIIPNYHSP